MQADKTLNIGRDRLFNLLGEYRLLVPVKRAYHKTTNSHHRFYRHPNLLKPGPEQVTALEPEQVWVADITYLPLRSGTGIRTPDTLPYTHFPGVLLQPLGHLTILYCCLTAWGATGRYYRELR